MTRLFAPPAPVLPYVRIIGEAATLRLVEAFPNCRLYVPHKVMPRGELARAIGVEAARLMGKHYGGEHLVIPSAKAWRVHIYADLGWSAGKIARKVGIGERAVYRQLSRRADRQSPQLQLL